MYLEDDNVTKYKFYDTDPTGKATYDISGKDYARLLDLCLKYCDSVSMCIHESVKIDLSSIEPFCIAITPEVKAQYGHYGFLPQTDGNVMPPYRLSHYLLTPEVKSFLLAQTNAIFNWTYAWGHNNPDDLAFFRPDGTVFFFFHCS